VRKQGIAIACIIGAILIAFFAGVWAGQSKGRKDTASEYEDRLVIIRGLNENLQAENIELAGINKNLRDRLGAAADIIGELDFRASTDYDTVQRLIDNLSRLEQAISVIFANGEN
jgi:hypothetical protein